MGKDNSIRFTETTYKKVKKNLNNATITKFAPHTYKNVDGSIDQKDLEKSYNNISSLMNSIENQLNKQISNVLDAVIYDWSLVKEFDKKQESKYKSSLEKALLNKNVKRSNKLIKKLKKLGMSNRKIKNLIASYISAANLKVTYKGAKSILLKNIKNKKQTPADPEGSAGATGATVVNAKPKKQKNKNKAKDKNKKNKSTNQQVVSAATMASYGIMRQKKDEAIGRIKTGTTNKIEQAKLNLTTRIAQINSDRDADIANIEAERDSKIAELYEQASTEINGIDPTDSNAKEQIDAIKADLENNINAVNEEANEQIEAVKADAEAQIAEANEASSSEIENIQKESDGEIDNITKNGLQEETTVGQDFETAADTPPTAKEVDETKINDANSNKEASTNSLEESRTAYNNDVSAKEQEINNTSNTQGEVEQQPIAEESSSSEETMVYQQESNNSSSSESNDYSNYSSSDYNNSGNESSNSGSGDAYIEETESNVVETPAIPEEELGSETTIIPDNPNNEELTEIESEVGSGSNSEIIDIPKKDNKSNVAIPIGLGVAAAGAAAVAGVRFVKNRKQNDNSEEMYDDENNGLDDYGSNSDDSEYMKDDYLGPSGSMYTDTDFEDDELSEIPDDTKYNDAAHLEEQIEDDNDAFTEDEILNDL